MQGPGGTNTQFAENEQTFQQGGEDGVWHTPSSVRTLNAEVETAECRASSGA